MISVLLGLIFLGLGIFGLTQYWSEFLIFVKGFLPFSLAVSGIIAILAGVSSLIQGLSSNIKKD